MPVTFFQAPATPSSRRTQCRLPSVATMTAYRTLGLSGCAAERDASEIDVGNPVPSADQVLPLVEREHAIGVGRREPARGRARSRDDRTGVDTGSTLRPGETAAARRHTLVQAVGRGRDAVIAVGGVHGNLEERESRERGRTGLVHPGDAAIVAADRTDAAVGRQGIQRAGTRRWRRCRPRPCRHRHGSGRRDRSRWRRERGSRWRSSSG